METNCHRPKWFDLNELILMRCRFVNFCWVWLTDYLLYWFLLIVLFIWKPMNLVYRKPIAIDQLDDRSLILSFLPILILDLIIDLNVISRWNDHISYGCCCAKMSRKQWLLPKLHIHNCFDDAIGRHRIQILLAPISLQLSWILSLFLGSPATLRRCQLAKVIDIRRKMIYWKLAIFKKDFAATKTWSSDMSDPIFGRQTKNKRNKNQSVNFGYLSFQNVLFALFIPNKLFAFRINQQIRIRLLSAEYRVI